jgi:hypothetical protein
MPEWLPYYCLIGVGVGALGMYLECLWPARQFEHLYPGGKPYRCGLVWGAMVFFAAIWPYYLLVALPDTIHTHNGRKYPPYKLPTPPPPPPPPSRPFVQEMGERRTSFGVALYIKVRTEDYRVLTWSEVWETFAKAYPDRWAIQCFPPADEVIDEVNLYHLWVLEDTPSGVNINRRYSSERGDDFGA